MMTPSAADCTINTLNNRAIGLTLKGDCRSAVKLFLQALSSLKREIVCDQTKCQSSPMTLAGDDGFFVRIRLQNDTDTSATAAMKTYNCLFGIDPETNPCSPQHRDGSTACILYNMALTEHQLSLKQPQAKAKLMYLKKATNIYNMAFSAAQHWKRYTKEHAGCQTLCLAILNNLLTIHYELKNDDKVSQLHSLLRDTLFSHGKGDDISSEELSLFAKNLQLCCGEGPLASAEDSQATTATSPSTCSDSAISQQPPAMIGAYTA